MSHLASIKQQQQSWGRRILGLFVAVWLNLALQPCAMAYQAEDDHDCPHCPPTETHEHGDTHVGMDHDMPCAEDAADCTFADDWNHDGRSGQFKLKDAPVELPIAIAPHELSVPFRQPTNATLRPRYTSVHAGAPPTLHILYCVYLD